MKLISIEATWIKKIGWGVLFMLYCCPYLLAQASDEQTWLFVNLNKKIGQKSIVSLQLWNRNYHPEAGHNQLYFINLAYKRALNKRIRLYAGVFNILYEKAPQRLAYETVNFNHYGLVPWQGLYTNLGRIGNVSFGSLTRIEEHFLFKESYDFDLRFRERLYCKYPIWKDVIRFNATTEILIYIDDDQTGLLVNPYEIRSYVGLVFKLNPNVLIEVDYGVFQNRCPAYDTLNYQYTTTMYMLSINYNL